MKVWLQTLGCIAVLAVILIAISARSSAPITQPPSIEGREQASIAAMEDAWSYQTSMVKFKACGAYSTKKDSAWESFNSGAQGAVLYVTWDEFMASHC
jgi:hypothetical protein